MRSPVRILYLTPFWPSERSFGAELRTAEVVSALQAVGQVDCVVLKNIDDPAIRLGAPNHPCRERVIQLQPAPPCSLWGRLCRGLDPKFINYYGHQVDERDRRSIVNALPSYDLIWVHQLRTANVFDQWSWPRSVMDLDDIPSSVLRSEWQNGIDLGRRLKAYRQMHVARSREQLLNERFTVLSVCSEADRRYLGFKDNVHIIPNGFTKPGLEPLRQPATPPKIGFIGTFDYTPNIESMRWFAEKCWPRIKQEVPEARLRLVGKGSDGPMKPAGRDIDSLGWVADATAEIASWSLMIVPVRIGGGTRIKIAEGFSRKCPIVSTSLGAHGYNATHGRELFLADSAEDFANACVAVIRRPAEAAEVAERAWQQFLQEWTWEAIRPRIWATAEQCLRLNSKKPVRKPADPE